LHNLNQPIFHALSNNQYRILIEAGADVNYCRVYTDESMRDYVEELIRQNKDMIKYYEGNTNEKTNIEQGLQYLNELLEEEKRVVKGSYREYALNCYTVEDYYDFLERKNPNLYPYRQNCVLRKHDGENEVNKKQDIKFLEEEISKLDHNKECLEYLINHGANTSLELKRERVNTIKNILEEQAGTLVDKEKKHYRREMARLQERIYEYQEVNEEEGVVIFDKSILGEIKIDFDKYIMKFRYINDNRKVLTDLVPEYVKLFQAVYVNDIGVVERMSQSLVLAVRDNFNMTPFMLACLRGHSELAVKILEIISSQNVSISDNMFVVGR
jgi:hypothetical protein